MEEFELSEQCRLGNNRARKELYEHYPTFATPYAKCLTHISWERYYIKDGYLMRANKLCILESSLCLSLLQESHG